MSPLPGRPRTSETGDAAVDHAAPTDQGAPTELAPSPPVGVAAPAVGPHQETHRLAAAREAGDRLAPLSHALGVVGDRWSPLLIASLLDGPRRFGELQERVAGIAPNVLSQRLRQLEQQGLVVAQPYSERPRRFLYELAEAGQELAGALRLLTDWGARHGAGDGAPPPRHETCGTALEARWYCPTCQEPVVAPDEGDDPGGLYYA